ncbi:RNA polymerase sigma factor SigJ, partial [Escherichia coli]
INPVYTQDKVSRFFAGIARRAEYHKPPLLRQGLIDGLPGYITREADGLLQTTALEIEDGKIKAIYIVRNPEKLGRIAVAN